MRRAGGVPRDIAKVQSQRRGTDLKLGIGDAEAVEGNGLSCEAADIQRVGGDGARQDRGELKVERAGGAGIEHGARHTGARRRSGIEGEVCSCGCAGRVQGEIGHRIVGVAYVGIVYRLILAGGEVVG